MDVHVPDYLHFSFPVEKAIQRFRELIIYVSSKSTEDASFGAVKLNKILYHSDFLAFYRFGVPLTGQRYFRIQSGPAPRAISPIARELAAEGAVRLDTISVGGQQQKRTAALREPVLSHFSKDELLLVDEVIATLWSQTATQIIDPSYDVKWSVLQHQDDLPYEFAYLDSEVTADDIRRTAELAREHGW
jgi:hypothetical protein